jgi:hypothetical protein
VNEAHDADAYLQQDHDPIEDDPQIGPLIDAATREAHEALADHPHRGQLGFCHVLWGKKKEILREKHGIEWRTPSEMDPLAFYD